MPVFSISVDSEGFDICISSNDCQRFDLAGIVAPDGQAKADAFADFIQDTYLDFKQRLNTLPNDDPDRTIDPARADLFWEGPGSPGQTDLVGRSILITVEWTGTEYIPTLRRLN